MKQIPAAKFKEQCLSSLDRVGPEGTIITKRGKPVARLIAATSLVHRVPLLTRDRRILASKVVPLAR